MAGTTSAACYRDVRSGELERTCGSQPKASEVEKPEELAVLITRTKCGRWTSMAGPVLKTCGPWLLNVVDDFKSIAGLGG
jgi:hypothetical protein